MRPPPLRCLWLVGSDPDCTIEKLTTEFRPWFCRRTLRAQKRELVPKYSALSHLRCASFATLRQMPPNYFGRRSLTQPKHVKPVILRGKSWTIHLTLCTS